MKFKIPTRLAIGPLFQSAAAEKMLRFGRISEASTPCNAVAPRSTEALEKATNGRFKMEVFTPLAIGQGNCAERNAVADLLPPSPAGLLDVLHPGIQ